jgi:CBS domain-containing protein
MALREIIWKDTVARLDTKAPVVVSPQATLRATLAVMRQACTGCVLVCQELSLVGVFTERDLVKRVFSKGVSLDRLVSEFMTSRPVTVHKTDTVGWVIRTMVEGHYRHLPVVDEQGRAIGIVSAKGIIQYFVDHVPLSVYNLPPRPGQVQKTREGA